MSKEREIYGVSIGINMNDLIFNFRFSISQVDKISPLERLFLMMLPIPCKCEDERPTNQA